MEMQDQEAEKLLLDMGVFSEPASLRRRMLACIACRWATCVEQDEPPEFTNKEIERCSGAHESSVCGLSQRLDHRGLIRIRPGLYPRLGYVYIPIDNTPEGIAFQDALVPPAFCLLKELTR